MGSAGRLSLGHRHTISLPGRWRPRHGWRLLLSHGSRASGAVRSRHVRGSMAALKLLLPPGVHSIAGAAVIHQPFSTGPSLPLPPRPAAHYDAQAGSVARCLPKSWLQRWLKMMNGFLQHQVVWQNQSSGALCSRAGRPPCPSPSPLLPDVNVFKTQDQQHVHASKHPGHRILEPQAPPPASLDAGLATHQAKQPHASRPRALCACLSASV